MQKTFTEYLQKKLTPYQRNTIASFGFRNSIHFGLEEPKLNKLATIYNKYKEQIFYRTPKFSCSYGFGNRTWLAIERECLAIIKKENQNRSSF